MSQEKQSHTTTTLTIKLSTQLKDRVQVIAERKETTMSAIVKQLLIEWVEAEERKG